MLRGVGGAPCKAPPYPDRKLLIEFIVRNKKVLISPNGCGYPYESTKNHIAGVMGCYKYSACPDQYGDRDKNSGEPPV
jgi:hypothetical protein